MIAVDIDPTCKIFGDFLVEPPVKIFGNCTVNNVVLNAFSYFSSGCIMHNVEVGRYSSIGDGTRIISSHPTDSLTTSPFPYQEIFRPPFNVKPRFRFNSIIKTVIGNDVWIGSGVKLKAGVNIGNGAIIGAGAVVTKDIEPYSIFGGVPARFIRQRFAQDIIDKLLTLEWWNYDLIRSDISWSNLISTIDDITYQIESMKLSPYQPERYLAFRDGAAIKARRIEPKVGEI